MFGGQFNNNMGGGGFPSNNNMPQAGQQMGVTGTATSQQPEGGGNMEQKSLMIPEQQQQQQQQQMPGTLPPNENPFYKTRICRLWREGNCFHGDNCCYAHGELEIRYPNMELLQQQINAGILPPGAGRGGMLPPPQPGNALMQQPPPHMQHRHTMQQIVPAGYGGGRYNAHGGGGYNNTNDSMFQNMLYKTKMCPSFVQRGWCNYEDKCIFAHSRQELRPFVPINDEMYMGMHRGDLGLPQNRERGHFGGQARPDMKLPGSLEQAYVPKQVTYLEKVRGLCGVIGLGNATDYTNKNPYVAAMAAEGIENGDMLKGNPYADDVRSYVTT